MLKRIRVQNFKGFRDSGSARLARLTLVLGKNSSGKTALLQPLLLLGQSVRADRASRTRAIELNGSYVELGSFKEAVHKHSVRQRMSIELDTELVGEDRRRMLLGAGVPARSAVALLNKESYLRYGLAIGYSGRSERIVIQEVSHSSDSIKLTRSRKSGQYTGVLSAINTVQSVALKDSDDFLAAGSGIGIPDDLNDIENASRFFMRVWSSRLSSVFFVPPLRDPGRRYYVDTTSAAFGDFSGRAVAADLRRWVRLQNPSLEFLIDWLKRFEIADDVDATRFAEGLISVRMRDPDTEVVSSVADFGFGTSQVLPLLLYGATNRRGAGTVIVHQPEVHLHPKAQATLANLFAEITQDGGQAIIETHSEHLVRRVQKLVLEGHLNAEDVSILFVDKDSSGATVHEIPVDEMGQMPGELPAGFLDTGYLEALDYQRAVAKRFEHE